MSLTSYHCSTPQQELAFCEHALTIPFFRRFVKSGKRLFRKKSSIFRDSSTVFRSILPRDNAELRFKRPVKITQIIEPASIADLRNALRSASQLRRGKLQTFPLPDRHDRTARLRSIKRAQVILRQTNPFRQCRQPDLLREVPRNHVVDVFHDSLLAAVTDLPLAVPEHQNQKLQKIPFQAGAVVDRLLLKLPHHRPDQTRHPGIRLLNIERFVRNGAILGKN